MTVFFMLSVISYKVQTLGSLFFLLLLLECILLDYGERLALVSYLAVIRSLELVIGCNLFFIVSIWT